jgi:Acetyltransferase (GNAT) domain
MRALTLDELDRRADAFDEVVASMPDIDHFCSSSAWILPAQAALMPRRRPWLFEGEHGYVAMMRGQHPDGWSYVEPLESMWGLACPLIGRDSALVATAFVGLCRERAGEWDVALLSGLAPGSTLCVRLVKQLAPHYELRLGPRAVRHVAELDGGIDAFLARRSRNFRRALRRALRDAEDAGIEFEPARPADAATALAVYERIVRVEARSWKGLVGVGIDSGTMHDFYRDMLPRLAAHDRLRAIFARRQDQDIGYILGAVFLGTYRGLQFSFDHDDRALGLGNLCQYRQILALCDEGVTRYDLGTDMEYKRRWSDTTHDTISLIALRR